MGLLTTAGDLLFGVTARNFVRLTIAFDGRSCLARRARG